jgi:hypothetical protein
MNQNTSKLVAGICRWTARIVGTTLVLAVLAIAVGEGMPNPFTQPLPVQLGFLGLALIMAGILTGWRWDVPAGIISLSGWCLFVMAVMKPPKGPNVFVCALALPAVLYLTSALIRRYSERLSSAENAS